MVTLRFGVEVLPVTSQMQLDAGTCGRHHPLMSDCRRLAARRVVRREAEESSVEADSCSSLGLQMTRSWMRCFFLRGGKGLVIWNPCHLARSPIPHV